MEVAISTTAMTRDRALLDEVRAYLRQHPTCENCRRAQSAIVQRRRERRGDEAVLVSRALCVYCAPSRRPGIVRPATPKPRRPARRPGITRPNPKTAVYRQRLALHEAELAGLMRGAR